MKRKKLIVIAGLGAVMMLTIAATTINNFFMPGSQPMQSGNLETPDKCDNCHGGYDLAVEPAFNWRGSMMAQAQRDPLYHACLAIAEQDAPGSGDLCIRCHAPDGWLNGRSTPTDGSALNNNDRQGVQCDFCHKLVKPSTIGTNPFPLNSLYTSGTYPRDQVYLGVISPNIPLTSGNGMYIADSDNAKRGPYSDATGRHQMYYSPFHSESDICGTCHDVSNPAFSRSSVSSIMPVPDEYVFNGYNVPGPVDPLLMFPVERTFSEWKKSDFNAASAAGGKTCQDCHMRDVTGKGAKLKDAIVRTDLPLHDMTGGNTFIPDLVKILYPAEVNAAALDAGKLRADAMLKAAADIEILLPVTNNTYTVKVINNTGHKLPSGYPEGRRIWINFKAYTGTQVVWESGAYDPGSAILNTTMNSPKIYEIKPGISPAWATTTTLPAGPSFHFAINNTIYSDNRIPPKGCTNQELIDIQSPVIGYSYNDNQYWDNTTYTVPVSHDYVVATLYYQTVSKEYIDFLQSANTTNSAGLTLQNLWSANGKSAPVEMCKTTHGTVPATPMTIQCSSVARIPKSGGSYAGVGTFVVTETSAGTAPVAGATVTVSYVGPTSGTATGTTDASGEVTIETSKKKNPSGTWCFTVTNVVKSGYAYVAPTPTQTCCEGGSFKLDPSYAEENSLSVYPNPVTDNALVRFTLAEDTDVRLEVYNSIGIRVASLANSYTSAGVYALPWAAGMMPRGVYFVRLTAGNGYVKTVKIVLR